MTRVTSLAAIRARASSAPRRTPTTLRMGCYTDQETDVQQLKWSF